MGGAGEQQRCLNSQFLPEFFGRKAKSFESELYWNDSPFSLLIRKLEMPQALKPGERMSPQILTLGQPSGTNLSSWYLPIALRASSATKLP